MDFEQMNKDAFLNNLFMRIVFNDDQVSFKKLFFDFYPSLCVYAGRYISTPETCEDIVQDTFLDLWKNRKKIAITSSFRNLLITIVKNKCVDYLRKQSLRKNYEERDNIHQTIMSGPDEIYTISELEEMLDSALNSMPTNLKKAFELSRFENMTYHKIAEEMGVSPKTVESYISKALSILRVELKDYFPLVMISCRIFIEHS